MPDLAVGRLVKTPEEIESTIAHFLALKPTDRRHACRCDGRRPSLVTGYDFLADAANARQRRVRAGARPAAPTTTSSTTPARHDASVDSRRPPGRSCSDSHHDLVYLAGHFSAKDTLAADFDQADTFEAAELAPRGERRQADRHPRAQRGLPLGLQHRRGRGRRTSPTTEDWSQQLARQQALLIGGTGYQYGDSDFLEYSERLYLGIARRLREGPATGTPTRSRSARRSRWPSRTTWPR